jgi:hypothetical protein
MSSAPKTTLCQGTAQPVSLHSSAFPSAQEGCKNQSKIYLEQSVSKKKKNVLKSS